MMNKKELSPEDSSQNYKQTLSQDFAFTMAILFLKDYANTKYPENPEEMIRHIVDSWKERVAKNLIKEKEMIKQLGGEALESLFNISGMVESHKKELDEFTEIIYKSTVDKKDSKDEQNPQKDR